MNGKMRIGELAEKAGVTTRTIRYYEKLGLLGPSEREGKGFRYYTEVELARLQLIDRLKNLGLTLEEIGDIIDMYSQDPTKVRGKQKTLEILQSHLKETEERIDTLKRFRAELQTNIANIQLFIEKTQQ